MTSSDSRHHNQRISPALKGVNLGAWLLLEKWMTPTLFEGTDAEDEYEFSKAPGAAEKLRKHRDTYITEADFAWLHDHNIDAVRIPVGYWILDGDAPYLEGAQYLDWAFDMAEKYSMQVVIDVHGLPGSQNGYDHSGRKGKAGWFNDAAYRRQTIPMLERLAKRYAKRPSLWGLQIINEPFLGPIRFFKVLAFYKKAYKSLVTILPENVRIIVGDGFIPRITSAFIPGNMNRIVLDVHLYHATTLFAQHRSLEWFYGKTKRRAKLIQSVSKKHPIIIGEWSSVLRHTTTQKMNDEQEAVAVKEYIRLQQEAYSTSAGWFYWTYKTESPGVWSFRTMVEEGKLVL